MSSERIGGDSSPRVLQSNDGRPPLEGDEIRATKKVKHREEPPLSGYKDRLVAGTAMEVTMGDLAHDNSVKVEEGDVVIDRSGLIPAVKLSAGLKERLVRNMRYSVVVNLLGRSIGYTSLCNKLRSMWNLNGARVLDLGSGYFLVQFPEEKDYLHTVLEGPWMMLGSYLQVQTWTSSFRVHHCTPRCAAVWIRISEMPLHLYPSDVMSAISEAVGPVLRVDYNTSDFQRGKFARVAVNVDLSKPLVSKFTVDDEEFLVEYENLNELCVFCGMYGHMDANCIRKPKDKDAGDGEQVVVPEEVVPKDLYGPWMKVEKRKRPVRRNTDDGSKENVNPKSGSRFNVIQNVEHETGADIVGVQVVNEQPLMTRDATKGTQVARQPKGKQGANREQKQKQNKGDSSKKNKPAKATLGEYFDFKQKVGTEENIVRQDTGLDAAHHTVMRNVVPTLSLDVASGSGHSSSVDFVPETGILDSNPVGRPPDPVMAVGVDDASMDTEENEALVEDCVDDVEGELYVDDIDGIEVLRS